jgi:hypothetical protein
MQAVLVFAYENPYTSAPRIRERNRPTLAPGFYANLLALAAHCHGCRRLQDSKGERLGQIELDGGPCPSGISASALLRQRGHRNPTWVDGRNSGAMRWLPPAVAAILIALALLGVASPLVVRGPVLRWIFARASASRCGSFSIGRGHFDWASAIRLALGHPVSLALHRGARLSQPDGQFGLSPTSNPAGRLVLVYVFRLIAGYVLLPRVKLSSAIVDQRSVAAGLQEGVSFLLVSLIVTYFLL